MFRRRCCCCCYYSWLLLLAAGMALLRDQALPEAMAAGWRGCRYTNGIVCPAKESKAGAVI